MEMEPSAGPLTGTKRRQVSAAARQKHIDKQKLRRGALDQLWSRLDALVPGEGQLSFVAQTTQRH